MASGNPMFVTPAPARTPSLARTPAPARTPTLAPTPTPSVMASIEDVIDLTEEEEYVDVAIPEEVLRRIPKSELLDFVKERCTRIFKTASKAALSDKLELKLKDRPDTLQRARDKDLIVHRYQAVWSKDLKEARKSLADEVKLAKAITDQHQREDDCELYRKQFVRPKERKLRQADHDIDTFEYLIKLLNEQAGI